MSKRRIIRLWQAFEDAFAKASQALGEPEGFQVHAHPWPWLPSRWRATTGKSQTEIAVSPDEVRHAGEALVKLANALPLVIDRDAGIAEMLSAHITRYDDSLWIEVLSPPENASVKLLTDAERAVDFAQSRDFGDDTSDWARAARTRCVRQTTFGGLDLMEPGAVWFIEWLESRGAQTLFSCEGHPHDFHVVFRGPYDLAHAIADVAPLTVSVFRSEGHPEKGQWKMELNAWPDTREERDTALRKLAEALARLE